MTTLTTTGEQRLEKISAYLESDLESGEKEKFEAMLDESDEAQRELSEMQKMLRMVGSLPEVQAPPDFADSVARKLRRRRMMGEEGGARGLGLMSTSFQLLSVVVIVAVAVIYLMLQLQADQVAIDADPEKGVLADDQGDQNIEQNAP